MFPNAKPSVDAVGRLGGLPGFLFSSPIIAGLFAMLMLPVFGGVTAWFFSLIGGNSVDLFEAARTGAVVAVLFGLVIYTGIFVSALFLPEERKVRLLFIAGGAIGLGVLVALDLFVAEHIRSIVVGGV